MCVCFVLFCFCEQSRIPLKGDPTLDKTLISKEKCYKHIFVSSNHQMYFQKIFLSLKVLNFKMCISDCQQQITDTTTHKQTVLYSQVALLVLRSLNHSVEKTNCMRPRFTIKPLFCDITNSIFLHSHLYSCAISVKGYSYSTSGLAILHHQQQPPLKCPLTHLYYQK